MSNNIVNKSLNPMKYIDQQQAKFVRRQNIVNGNVKKLCIVQHVVIVVV